MNDERRLLAGRYEVGELIGRGGMADVHLGYDTRLGREVAVKILRSELARDRSFLMRFRREAQSAASLNHPNIVAVFDSGEESVGGDGGAPVSVPFIVMEYVRGRTLRDVLAEDGPLDPFEAGRVMAQVLRALDYSHDHGIIHRDIKPANVMMAQNGQPKVMDFGIARAIADTAGSATRRARRDAERRGHAGAAASRAKPAAAPPEEIPAAVDENGNAFDAESVAPFEVIEQW